VTQPTETREEQPVVSLADALKASLAAAEEGDDEPGRKRQGSGSGSGAASGQRKRQPRRSA
jgi:hypothetical protein